MNKCKSTHMLLKAAGHRFCQACGKSFNPAEDMFNNLGDKLSRFVMCGYCGETNGHHCGESAKNEYWCRGKDDFNYFFPVNCTPEINHKSLLKSNLKFCYNCGLDLKEDKSELLSRK